MFAVFVSLYVEARSRLSMCQVVVDMIVFAVFVTFSRTFASLNLAPAVMLFTSSQVKAPLIQWKCPFLCEIVCSSNKCSTKVKNVACSVDPLCRSVLSCFPSSFLLPKGPTL